MPSFLFLFYTAPQHYFDYFSDPKTQLGSAVQGPNTDSDGCFFFNTATETRVCLSSIIYFETDSGEFVCCFARSFLSVQDCFFLRFFAFYMTATETRVRLLSNICIYYSL